MRAEAPIRRRLAATAPILDGLCLCLFVLLGRESHGIDQGPGWFFVVVWPFIAGWLAAALVLGTYTSRTQPWMRLAATEVLGIAIAVLLRVTVTHRDAPVAFVAVAYGFIVLTTLGWRVVVFAMSRVGR